MFEFNGSYNLSIGHNLFKSYISKIEKSNETLTTDDLHFVLLAMVGAIAIHNPHAPFIYTTLDNIIITMAQDINFKATNKIKNGLMNGFNILKKYGAITMSEEFNGDKKQIVCIKTNALCSDTTENKNSYFQISRTELATIMKESNTPHHLIAIMCNYCSRFNIQAYISFDCEKDTWKKTYYDSGVDLYKKLSCWASQKTIRNSWINSIGAEIERISEWNVTQAQFSKYCQQLIDFKIFDRIVINNDGNKISHYFRPMHKKCVEWSLELLEKQQDYMEQQPKEESKQPSEPIQPKEEPKPFGIPRGGERKPSNCIPLTEIEASHTSDANRKVHEKVKARNWNDTIEHIETTGKEIEFDLTDLYIQPKCSKKVSRDKKW